MFRKFNSVIVTIVASLTLNGCHSVEDFADDIQGNFDALWTALDQHYCFFEEKDIDWNAVYHKYSALITDETNIYQLFDICSAMLDELRDGHTNLIAPFNTSYYRAWWSDYPQNFDLRLIQQYYFNFDYRQTGGIMYQGLPQNIGYMRYSSFTSAIGELNLDYVLAYFAECDGLIIDVRDNGGGNMTNVEILVSRFINSRLLAGYIQHKTGPGHNDFSEPFAFYYDPAPEGRIRWEKPVVVLANRSTYSAANNFVSIMKSLPNVTIVGATTGGGSGMPFSSELPVGWSVRFSASPVYNSEGQLTEFGVEPSEGCAVDLDPIEALSGRDTMLDFAIEYLTNKAD